MDLEAFQLATVCRSKPIPKINVVNVVKKFPLFSLTLLIYSISGKIR